MALKITADKIATQLDGWDLLTGRFRVHAVKCGPGLVISPGAAATAADWALAQTPQVFSTLDAAIKWLEPRIV